MAAASFVHVNVGGFPYSIAMSDIEKFPGSFFGCMIKKEWTKDSAEAISIQRDGALFKFVNAFMVTGHLPRNRAGFIDLEDATLDRLKEEADFYGMEKLSKECNILRRKGSELDLNSYLTIRKYMASLDQGGGELSIDHSSRLARALKCAWSPFCVSGRLGSYSLSKLYGDTSVNSINVEELIAVAAQSPFGRGTETVVDTTVRNSFEIDASMLDSSVLDSTSAHTGYQRLAPHLNLTVRPYKLVIYREGGHFDSHRDTVRGDGHIGTLVVILNSTYTGGELEVTHGGRTEVVTGPYSWVAMYGDCLHKINPVTSGTRVSLIYDIYGAAPVGRASTSTVEGVAVTSDVGVGGDDGNVEEVDDVDDVGEEEEEEEEEEDGEEEEEEKEEENWDEDEDEYSDDEHFWGNQPKGRYRYSSQRIPEAPDRRRRPHDADIAQVYEALDNELVNHGSIIICLQHLYPECQTNPAFLKGGDRVLYDILTSGSSALGKYEVQVVAATIYRNHDYGYEHFFFNRTRATLFSPAIVKRTLGIKNDSDTEEEIEGPLKKQKVESVDPVNPVNPENAAARSVFAKLVLPNGLNYDNLLDYTPYDEHAGNEPQEEESVYIVAGLQVRSKVCKYKV